MPYTWVIMASTMLNRCGGKSFQAILRIRYTSPITSTGAVIQILPPLPLPSPTTWVHDHPKASHQRHFLPGLDTPECRLPPVTLSTIMAGYLAFPPFSPASHDHDGRSGIARWLFLHFWQMRVFLNAQDLPRWMHQAALIPQVMLAIGMAISGAALDGVADLKATPEVAKTNRVYC